MSSNEYMREYMLRRYHRRKAEAIKKLGGRCARCGSTKNLQFDHIDRTKKSFTLGKVLAGMSKARFERELKKCQLLCEKCHARKTCEDLGQTWARGTHGTVSAYRYCGPPKCEECKAAKAKHQRERRMKMETRLRLKQEAQFSAPP